MFFLTFLKILAPIVACLYNHRKGGDFVKLFWKILCILLGAGLLLAAIGAVWVFLIGEPVDGDAVICDVEELENQVNIYVTTPSSGIAFRDDARLRQEGTQLHITLRKVPVSPLCADGDWSMYVEKTGITQIYLGGKLIWSEQKSACSGFEQALCFVTYTARKNFTRNSREMA